jgi:hypothetical protein
MICETVYCSFNCCIYLVMLIIIVLVVLFSCITTLINTVTVITTTKRVMLIVVTGEAMSGNSIYRMSYMYWESKIRGFCCTLIVLYLVCSVVHLCILKMYILSFVLGVCYWSAVPFASRHHTC